MIVLSAFLILTATASPTDAYESFLELSKQLDHKVEWIDSRGSRVINRSQAIALLNNLTDGVDNPEFSLRHNSQWKNDQCYRIIEIAGKRMSYRVFFHCKKKKSNKEIVTKIKITENR